jgi:pyruvate dehydrogenase E2 component (dihydrolipoamide acetyltransferase)
MRESVVNAPQFALDVAADMTQLLWLRDQLADRVEAAAGARPTITGLLVMAVADALTRHPRANAEYADGWLRVHSDVNFGVAVGTFTLSNLGMYGVDGFRAIVNPPQSAILAVGRIVKTPVGIPDEAIALRPMMNLTLTVDHRCMDGVQAARFLAEVKALLEQPHLLLV